VETLAPTRNEACRIRHASLRVVRYVTGVYDIRRGVFLPDK